MTDPARGPTTEELRARVLAQSGPVLPFVPEPVLTPAERAALSELYRDPAYWEWFERQPEPLDSEGAERP